MQVKEILPGPVCTARIPRVSALCSVSLWLFVEHDIVRKSRHAAPPRGPRLKSFTPGSVRKVRRDPFGTFTSGCAETGGVRFGADSAGEAETCGVYKRRQDTP